MTDKCRNRNDESAPKFTTEDSFPICDEKNAVTMTETTAIKSVLRYGVWNFG
ncbi:hypothetical protein MAHJHV51_56790 [Mycobacterium avium subsp. hominissuis]